MAWWQFLLMAMCCFSFGLFCGLVLHACLVGPAIDARDEAINLAIRLIGWTEDAHMRAPFRRDADKFMTLVREIPERWAPPTSIVIRRD